MKTINLITYLTVTILLMIIALPSLVQANPGGVSDNLQLWLKADAGIGEIDGQTLSTWTDQSPNAYPASNTAGDGQTSPTFRNNTTDNFNFNPVVEFDGVANGVDLAGNYIYSINTGLTFFAVIKPDIKSFNKNFVFDFGKFGDAGYGFMYSNDKLFMYTATAYGGISSGLNHSYNTNPVVYTGKIDFGTEQRVYLNGTSTYNNTITLTQLSTSEILENPTHDISKGPITIGRQSKPLAGNDRLFDGTIAEVILYDVDLADADRNKVQSYLALKYGITLDSTIDYVNSSGTVIYPSTSTHSGYTNNIAGIGTDNGSNLSQPKSLGVNGIITITGFGIADGNFLIWGNDNGALTLSSTEVLGGGNRLVREWRVAEIGDVGLVTISFDLSSVGGADLTDATKYSLLTDADGNFSDTTMTIGATINGSVVEFSGINLSDGQYFSLAYTTNLVLCTVQTEIPQAQCETLVALYDSTDGPNWTDNATNNWTLTTTPCTLPWTGVTCIGSNVTQINRNNQNLIGTIPDLSALTSLRRFNLSINQLTGNIPSWLNSFPNLQYLDLSENKLTGAIPDLSNLNLKDLFLDNNQLTGIIPTYISDFTNLKWLYLYDNKLEGTIPNLNNLTSLTNLKLQNNQLIGTIPALPASLTTTDLGYNAFTAETDGSATVKDSDWKNTQTIPPTLSDTNVLSNTSIKIKWTPIIYTDDDGHYQVKYATTKGGPYTNASSTTADKLANNYTVTDLTPATTYYFVVETFTPVHDDQQSDLTSILSEEIIQTTPSSNTCSSPIVVTNSNNSGTGSLRQAIVDLCTDGTIKFDNGYNIILISQLVINKNLTIDGTNKNIRIDGDGITRVLKVNSGTIELNDLTIKNGYVEDDNGAGILINKSSVVLTINNSNFDSNFVECTDGEIHGGGAIHNIGGNLTVNDTTFTNNQATNVDGRGGAIRCSKDCTTVINNSTLSSNSANRGGALWIANGSGNNVTINNSTFYNNSAKIKGGAIGNLKGIATINNSTFSDNKKTTNGPGGIYNSVGATLSLKNTIIANSTGDDCENAGTVGTDINNLINSGNCGTLNSADPLLSALANNNGSTKTMALQVGSLAINAGDNATCLTTDQRNITRPQGVACDIGAYETLPTCPSGNIAYVDKTATGNNDASDWDNAFTELRSVLSSVYLSKCPGITEIHVAQGTYTPGILRSDTFQLQSNLAIYGGYPNGGGSRNSNPATNNTILSGEIGVTGVTDNSYHVVFSDNTTDNTAILNGFTISYGYAEESTGGGIFNSGGSPILKNLIVSNNQSDGFGGGIFTKFSGSPVLNNILIENNISNNTSGGGFASRISTPTLNNVIIRGNYAGLNGGGVNNIDGSNITMNNVVISGNEAFSKGGGISSKDSTATLTNVTITGNHATLRGGGIRSLNTSSSFVLNNVIIWGNTTNELGSESFVENGTGTHTVSYSIIEGSSTANWWTINKITDNGNNIDIEPLFVTAVPTIPSNGGDLHLQIGSPAIDIGNNCPSTDLDGITRPQGAGCDIGAYEFVSAPPIAPTNLIATVISDTQIDLNWTDNSNNETGFKIERDDTLITTTLVNIITYSNMGLTCGTTYNYSVKATNTFGDSVATTASATTQACSVVTPPIVTAPTISHKLTINKIGSGQVTGEGINCGSDCIQHFNEDTEVILTATPNQGFAFTSWQGDCAGTANPLTITITADMDCSATFIEVSQLDTFTLNIGNSVNGTITYANSNCGASNCVLASGTQTQITATPNEGFVFTSWQGDCTGTANPLTITITADMDCKAEFTKLSQPVADTFTLNLTDSVNGTVTYANTDCIGNNCVLANGSQIQITATPNAGFTFTGWQGDCVGTANPLTVTITANMDCKAEFAKLSQPIADTKTPISTDSTPVKPPIVSQSEELAIDGNGDGILDNEQIYVITIPDAVTGNLLTLASHVGCPIKAVSAHTEEEQDFVDKTYNFPQGLMYYVLQCTQARVTIYFHGISQLRTRPVYQKYGPTTPGDLSTLTWYTFPNVTFGKARIDGQPVVSARFTLTDGELGDNTGVDGRIVDPGGIGFSDEVDNVISFIAKTYSASRQAGNATITVNRNGLVGSLAVYYNVLAGSAVVGQDFQPVSGTLTWADNERGDKTFIIPFFSSATVGATVQLTLTNLTSLEGAFLGINAATLFITDDAILTTQAPAVVPSVQGLISPVNILYRGHAETIIDDITIGINGHVANLIFAGHVTNYGLVSNSTFLPTGSLTGGNLSGYIYNEGVISDTNFIGGALTGGTLAGTITNNSKVGGIIQNVQLAPNTTLSGGKVGGIIKSVAESNIQDIQLIADTIIVGGTLSGEIKGISSEQPAQIGAATIAPGTVLENVRLSPTVKLSDDVILGPNVKLPNEPPTLADFGIEPAEVATLDANALNHIEPAAFSAFTPADFEQIPLETLSTLGSEHLAELTTATLAELTVAQFSELSSKAIGGLTSANMGGLSPEVLNNFTLAHLDAINPKEFQRLPSQDISKILTNFNGDNISPKDVRNLLPAGWAVDANTGDIKAPIGAKLTLRSLPTPATPANIALPKVVNLDAGFGVGGKGTSVKENIEHSLANQDLSQFVLSQNEQGILLVEGTGDVEGINYSFIPDVNNVIQVDTDKIPIGLAVGEGGFYTITTPDGQQYKVTPAPKDPMALSKAIGDGRVIVGKRGDVFIELSPQTRRGKARRVIIFDPFIIPPPDDLCVEITPLEIICDFDNAPENLRPGFHLPKSTRKLEQAKVIYHDGTAQTVYPTILSPDTFIEEGLKFTGVKKLFFNTNGTFYVFYEGKSYLIKPNFVVRSQKLDNNETGEAAIVLNQAEGRIRYTIPLEPQRDENRRRGRETREILIFDPFIEPAPDLEALESKP